MLLSFDRSHEGGDGSFHRAHDTRHQKRSCSVRFGRCMRGVESWIITGDHDPRRFEQSVDNS